MESRHLRTFRAVASSLSFTRASTELGYAQSSITSHIQALEKELGVPLFDRLGKRVALTEAGKRLHEYAGKLVNLEEEARAVVSGDGQPSGTLSISAAETHCTYRLPPILSEFRTRYQDVRLILRPSRSGALDDELKRGLNDGSVDLAFIMEEPVESPNLLVEPLVPEPALIVAPPDHPLASLPAVGPRDFAGEAVLLTEEGCAYRRLFEGANKNVAPETGPTILEFASVEAIKQCCVAGTGIAVLSAASVEKDINRGRLVELPWTGPEFGVVTQIVRHKDKWLSPNVAAFLEVTRELCPAGSVSTADYALSSLNVRDAG